MFSLEKWDKNVEHYTLTNGDYSVGVISLGASLQSFKYKDIDIVLGFDNARAYFNQTCFMGQVVGPVSNRIKNAAFSLDGKIYNLDKNDNGNCLHSGSANFGLYLWTLDSYTDNSVSLRFVSGKTGGFDQVYDVKVTYTLDREGSLSIDYEAEADRKAPVSLTNHAYFNLGGGDVRQSAVKFGAKGYLDTDENLIPTVMRSVENTEYDFSTPKKIIERNNGCYDICIISDGTPISVENNGLKLTMISDMPAFQFYTGIHLTTVDNGKDGKPYSQFDGFALESQFCPDFVNRPDFEGCCLNGNDKFTSKTVYRLECLEL